MSALAAIDTSQGETKTAASVETTTEEETKMKTEFKLQNLKISMKH